MKPSPGPPQAANLATSHKRRLPDDDALDDPPSVPGATAVLDGHLGQIIDRAAAHVGNGARMADELIDALFSLQYLVSNTAGKDKLSILVAVTIDGH